jgi:hypothetical protein
MHLSMILSSISISWSIVLERAAQLCNFSVITWVWCVGLKGSVCVCVCACARACMRAWEIDRERESSLTKMAVKISVLWVGMPCDQGRIPWRWTQLVPPQCWWLSVRLHHVSHHMRAIVKYSKYIFLNVSYCCVFVGTVFILEGSCLGCDVM